MLSYLGCPIMQPDGALFGTFCVLDSRTNTYSERIERLMTRFRDLIEPDLAFQHMHRELGDVNRKMGDILNELRVLRGYVSVCAPCKAVKDGGAWKPLNA